MGAGGESEVSLSVDRVESEVSLGWTGWKVRGESVGGESEVSLGGESEVSLWVESQR